MNSVKRTVELVYGLLRPFRRPMRPATTPAIHSSPMLSKMRLADARSRTSSAPFFPAARQDSTSLRSLVTGFWHLLSRLAGFPRRPRHDGVHRQRASSSSKAGQRA
jgi:hypothetical protein